MTGMNFGRDVWREALLISAAGTAIAWAVIILALVLT